MSAWRSVTAAWMAFNYAMMGSWISRQWGANTSELTNALFPGLTEAGLLYVPYLLFNAPEIIAYDLGTPLLVLGTLLVAACLNIPEVVAVGSMLRRPGRRLCRRLAPTRRLSLGARGGGDRPAYRLLLLALLLLAPEPGGPWPSPCSAPPPWWCYWPSSPAVGWRPAANGGLTLSARALPTADDRGRGGPVRWRRPRQVRRHSFLLACSPFSC